MPISRRTGPPCGSWIFVYCLPSDPESEVTSNDSSWPSRLQVISFPKMGTHTCFSSERGPQMNGPAEK